VSTAVDPREARLPKWAQAEMSALRRRLVAAERHIRNLTGDIDATDTVVEAFEPGTERDYPLPPGSQVTYKLYDRPHGADVRVRINRDSWDGVTLYVSGDRPLLIKPSASNCFYVTMPDD
jgi:hypothetical protein